VNCRFKDFEDSFVIHLTTDSEELAHPRAEPSESVDLSSIFFHLLKLTKPIADAEEKLLAAASGAKN
jgi:hypothetical protein